MRYIPFLGAVACLALSAAASAESKEKEHDWLFVYTKSRLDTGDAKDGAKALGERARERDVQIDDRRIRVTMPTGRKIVMSFLVERRAREFYAKMLKGNIIDVSLCAYPERRIGSEQDPAAPDCSFNTYTMVYDCLLLAPKAQVSWQSPLAKTARYRVIGPEYEDVLETRYECNTTPADGKKI